MAIDNRAYAAILNDDLEFVLGLAAEYADPVEVTDAVIKSGNYNMLLELDRRGLFTETRLFKQDDNLISAMMEYVGASKKLIRLVYTKIPEADLTPELKFTLLMSTLDPKLAEMICASTALDEQCNQFCFAQYQYRDCGPYDYYALAKVFINHGVTICTMHKLSLFNAVNVEYALSRVDCVIDLLSEHMLPELANLVGSYMLVGDRAELRAAVNAFYRVT